MGSGSEVLESAVAHLNKLGQKVGLIKVRLFRPWSAEHLLAALPKTAKRITVMDRTKEHGSGGGWTRPRRAGRAVSCAVGASAAGAVGDTARVTP